MAYRPYDGPIVPLDQTHYHNWFLTTMPVPWETLAYVPGMRGYLNRKQARRHGQQYVEIEGLRGLMVLQCEGGDDCPAMFAGRVA